MKELTYEQILHHLKQNTIGRNQQLSMLVKVINSAKENTVLAIDGPWGAGKTVFISQLLMLADGTVADYGRNSLEDTAISKLRETYQTYYFNAWENDFIGDALGAVLLKLIADSDDGLNSASLKRAFSTIDIPAALKNLSHDAINLEGKTDNDKLTENVRAIVDRHDTVNKFLDDLKKNSSKDRIVFVIDELDRCKPSFAVDILEVMKHYFGRDDITFIVTTNTGQLAHTVEKYYGYNFDGYAYLNKFIDYTMSLKKVDASNYVRNMLDWNIDYGGDETAKNVIDYYKFEMREINSYYSSLKLIANFLHRDNQWHKEQYPIQLIFVPLALGLKIRSFNDYSKFISGKGGDLLRNFLSKTESRLDLADMNLDVDGEITIAQRKEVAIESLVKQYAQLIAQSSQRGGRESLQDFNDAISLMSSYTTISEPEAE